MVSVSGKFLPGLDGYLPDTTFIILVEVITTRAILMKQKTNPDFFLRDQNGETFFTEAERPNRTEYSVCFDYSNPAARE